MHKYIWVGLDVHKAAIAVAVAKGWQATSSGRERGSIERRACGRQHSIKPGGDQHLP